MATESVTFRIDAEARAALDQLAAATNRDRGSLISEAVEAYFDVEGWHIAHIGAGLAQAETDAFATDAEVAAFWKGVR